jgi:hypothetical protein
VNEVPPQDEPDDADRLYRRASAQDDSRPSEMVRRRVLKHAAQLATERAAQKSAAGAGPVRAANQRWQRPVIFGTLAAAALAGLLVTPRFFSPGAPPPMATQPATAALQPKAASTPAAQSPPRPAQAPPMPPPAAEYAANNSPVTTETTGGASAKPAASAKITASARVAASENAAASVDRAADAQHDPDVAATAGRLAGAAAPAAAGSAAARSLDPAEQLRRAAQTGDMARLQLLVTQQSPDARDAEGRTALMLAVLRGQSQAVEVLLANGADPNAADARGTTPLQAALAGHQQTIAATLQRAGAR